ncbi:MAG: STAS/SEC14 domain-containing protein [Gammaproteobacteria bacterium]|nr:STAS/SEC14 domain-containing protein [Gammaproteobacteria bacterium]
MIRILTDLPDKVLGLSARGRVTAEDYAQTITPALEDRLTRHEKVRLLYHLGPDFERFTTTALWDDARLGMHHLRDFDRIAVVTDVGWIRGMVRALKPLAGDIRLFANTDLDQARDWVSAV